MANPTMEGAQKKVERLKKFTDTDNFIKSPIINDPNRNPCIKEQNASAKCWYDNDYDKTACKDFYDDYRMCMKFWNYIEWERKFNGIYPTLPPPAERPRIMEERLRNLKEDESLKAAIFRGIFSS